ncbi:MAG: nickel pincer cofactor biosynthesis protein LarC [Firmicutes bacterium]|nr:nickel pincer cofactor biosynthesis protein LarC [Bacillota bacterium]
MKVLFFDCFSGISGDMALGALLDLGINEKVFRRELEKLNLTGYRVEIEKKQKSGIYGTDVTVIVEDDEHDLYSHTACNLTDIELLIDKSDLKQKVKDFSKKVFREIARAEAKVHNKGINEVHFHEVGAVDSIVDIVGTAICIDLLGVDKVFSSPLYDGKGFIECQHGIIPVPVPAVMEMLSGSNIPLITTDINTELVTPTGMGLIKCLALDFGNMPAMIIDRIGYGMGKREIGRLNALRVVLGDLLEEKFIEEKCEMDEILILETNIDDISPEILGYTLEQLMNNGALDAYYIPVYMKKNRPGVLLTVLGKIEDEDKLIDIVFRETSTLGIRRSITRRYCMDREIRHIETQYGKIRVKIATKGESKKISPEYEDCKEIAKRNGIPLREVYNLVYSRYYHN